MSTDYDDIHSTCGTCGCGPCACDECDLADAIAAHEDTDLQCGLRIAIDGSVTEVTWTPETALTAMQDAVGGYIEMVALPTYGLRLVCHDEAKLREDWPQRINRHATDLFGREHGLDLFAPDRILDTIAGPVLVISERATSDGDSVGLSACGLSDLRCWLVTGHLEPEGHGVR